VLSDGDDIVVVTSGITTEEAMRAAQPLAEAGVGMKHLHVSTHKPFADPLILDSIERSRHGVITLENHTIIGGLGSAVAEKMADAGSGKRLLRLGLRDSYAHGASRAYLMREYELDAAALVAGVEELTGKRTGITEDDLALARVEATHSLAKAEGL
jgi:transketolase